MVINISETTHSFHSIADVETHPHHFFCEFLIQLPTCPFLCCFLYFLFLSLSFSVSIVFEKLRSPSLSLSFHTDLLQRKTVSFYFVWAALPLPSTRLMGVLWVLWRCLCILLFLPLLGITSSSPPFPGLKPWWTSLLLPITAIVKVL